MVPDNIKMFDQCAAEIFAYLYAEFPLESVIQINDFKNYDNEEHNKIFFSTIRFLEREGFIHYSQAVYGGFVGVVLTTKGFAILNSTPATIEENEPLGVRIGKAVKSGAQELITGVIQEVFKSFVLSK